jgi:hypothetical protein
VLNTVIDQQRFGFRKEGIRKEGIMIPYGMGGVRL